MFDIEERKRWLKTHFYIHLEEVNVVGDYHIVNRSEYYGIIETNDAGSEKELLPTLYDGIYFIGKDIVSVTFDGKVGFYSISDGNWIILPVCDDYSIDSFYNTISIVCDKGKGLIDISKRKLLIEPAFEDTTINSTCKYLWVKKNDFYHYINKETGTLIYMPGAIGAYDDNSNMFIRLPEKKVLCLNELGEIDYLEFRRVVKLNNGRLRLKNFKYHTMDVVDVYGQILN